MNILVTGANGQLGTHVRLLAPSSVHRYFFTDVEELDIAKEGDVLHYVHTNQINAIINCAAYTDVDKSETEEAVAYRINCEAVAILARAMKAMGGLLVHISTDYVFGGGAFNTPCAEDLPVNPTGAYGRTKLAGEEAVLHSGCRYLIFRTAWLYSEYGKNFCKTMLRLTASKPQLSVVFDQVGTPTYAGDLAAALFSIVEGGLYVGNEGICHYSNEGLCSWYDFAVAISRLSGNGGCTILPCHSSEFPSSVVRPSYSVLDKTKFKQTFRLPVPYWTDSLRKCLSNLNCLNPSL